MKKFMDAMARRLRKCRGALLVGTQSVNDFYKNEAATAILENSDWMCLLSQKKESIDALKRSGRLSMEGGFEAALRSIHSGNNYSEILIYHSEKGYAITRLKLDSFAALLYTTKAEDYSRIMDMRDRGMSIIEAIETLDKSKTVGL